MVHRNSGQPRGKGRLKVVTSKGAKSLEKYLLGEVFDFVTAADQMKHD
jgi:hypothetical protein